MFGQSLSTKMLSHPLASVMNRMDLSCRYVVREVCLHYLSADTKSIDVGEYSYSDANCAGGDPVPRPILDGLVRESLAAGAIFAFDASILRCAR